MLSSSLSVGLYVCLSVRLAVCLSVVGQHVCHSVCLCALHVSIRLDHSLQLKKGLKNREEAKKCAHVKRSSEDERQ